MSLSSEPNAAASDDSGITMLDVLEEETSLDSDANAVLGGSDDKNCTYEKGYVNRQALYACKTCKTTDGEPTGVCLACSYACHEDHDLIELYTKRNFRCDCGNSKFLANKCKLYPHKDSTNKGNKYNQNFQGTYCTCKRPYPDPTGDDDDEMIQCIICEDWFHAKHLDGSIPANSDFAEMICSSCMVNSEFLQKYTALTCCVSNRDKIEKSDTEEAVNVTSESESKPESFENCISSVPFDFKSSEDTVTNAGCQFKILLPNNSLKDKAVFWNEEFRHQLCKCKDCMKIYCDSGLSFLVESDDTVHSYEERGKADSSDSTRFSRGMEALSTLDRVKQVEAIHEYNEMKLALKDFLKGFADENKVVKKEDIDGFFDQMKDRKRRKTDEGFVIPHHCR